MRSGRTVIWVVVALLFVDLTFFSGASNFLASPQSRILNQVLVLCAVIVAAIAGLRGRVDLRSPLLLPGAAWVVATAVAAQASLRPAASIEALALLLIGAPAYLVVRAILADQELRVRVDWLIGVSTFAFVVAYLLQALTQWLSWWSVAGPSFPPLRPGDVGLTVGTVNAVALYLELLVPIALWLTWQRWHARSFTIVFAALAVSALIVTASRGAWLGAVAGVVAALALSWRQSGVSVRRMLVTPGGLVAAIGVLGAVIVVLPLIVERMLIGDAGRLELWSAAWSMVQGSPLFGVGPGAWPSLRALTTISDATFAVLATSHSSVLQVLVDAGALGAVAGLWLLLAIARLAWRALGADQPPAERRLAIVAVGSLIAAGVHSLVDTQSHIPGVALLILHLVARLESAAARPLPAVMPGRRPATAVGIGVLALALVGGAILVPIDRAMIAAAAGNLALDRGDPAAAAREFDAAVELHDLPPYRLGQALARRALGDDQGAAESLRLLEAAEPWTFVTVQRAALEPSPFAHWQDADRAGSYDPTANVNLAAQRADDEPDAAAWSLGTAMVQVPTLYFSTRPTGLLSDRIWSEAQLHARRILEAVDPVTAAAVVTLADQPELAASLRTAVPPGAEADALRLLAAAADGRDVDVAAATAILREAPDSPGVQFTLWQLGFKVGSQPILDAVRAVSVPLTFKVPMPPMELVTDGRVGADYSLRLPRWPQASAGRNGPKRPYISGFITIEPVFRPKP